MGALLKQPQMDLVLVLNVGSSSLKACLIGAEGHRLWQDQRPWSAEAAAQVLDEWLPSALAPWLDRLGLAAHRVVHGGERFTAPTQITAQLEQDLEALVPLAPLHNGSALAVIRWLGGWRPDLPQWACFDTAFHSTLPERAFTSAIPAGWRAGGLRRFGFHGLNHQHVSETVASRRGEGEPLRLISCHLGAGCSLAAIRDGRSIDTTMGFTPLEGLVMASRSGSLDPGLLLHQLRGGMAREELEHALQKESGLLGLSGGLSADMRVLRQAAAEGHPGACLALSVFLHRLLQGIGAMAASLGGVDVIALSGGIGENDAALFDALEAALDWLLPFELVRVPADEEGMIARLCQRQQRLGGSNLSADGSAK
jgi:acetate kinase